MGQISGWAGALSSSTADADGTAGMAIGEGSAALTVLFTATASGVGTVTYAFTDGGNPNNVALTTITAGAVTLAKALDYETAPSLVFKVV